jgi:NAD(P)-dependent dehydrogenase (short-subunit alcohol dehydrogenase family)
MRLQGKRAVVTGGANGIGRATAERFAREGARVIIADRNLEAGAAAVETIRGEGGQADFVPAEMTDEAVVAGLFARADSLMGGIDVLVSNAGWSLTEDLLGIEPEDWHRDVTLNLTSHYLAARAALPVMIRGGGGSIVTISSVNALWCIGEFGYSAAKAGLISLTKNLAVTYGPRGIRANVICPGTIATEAGAAYWDQKAGAKEKLLKWYPLGRLGRPEDVANLALFLASDESSFVTGATMVVDGGLTAGSRLFGNL